jgi:hypothetical protein
MGIPSLLMSIMPTTFLASCQIKSEPILTRFYQIELKLKKIFWALCTLHTEQPQKNGQDALAAPAEERLELLGRIHSGANPTNLLLQRQHCSRLERLFQNR